MCQAATVSCPGKIANCVLIVRCRSGKITLKSIGLPQVVLQHRSQDRIAAEAEGFAVGFHCQVKKSGFAADIA
ncbi:Uncharacterised protein [uncultured archaeon]|nr:Uncharacterised protein [uncultured archaeon]